MAEQLFLNGMHGAQQAPGAAAPRAETSTAAEASGPAEARPSADAPRDPGPEPPRQPAEPPRQPAEPPRQPADASRAPAPEPPREAAARLSAELEAALVRELMEAYQTLNYTHFRRKLRSASIELSDAASRLGRWISEARAIEISRPLVLTQPWGVVIEVLKHEMAHQYVHEVLGVTDEAAHGPAFREVCARLGIDATASGMPAAAPSPADPGAAAGGDAGADARILDRIARLLALADSPNANEAQAAMSAAQRLMLKYNLDVAKARAARQYGFRHLGTPSGRVGESERIVGGILGKHFFVEAIWVPVYVPLEGKRGSILEICGTPANLEMAAYVHAFLHHTAEQLWREHKRAHGVKGDKDRRTYIAGVMLGFLEKLNTERKASAEQGLVWVRDADLDSYYRTRHPRVQHLRHTGNQRTAAHAHGREAGRKIVLHRPMQGATGERGLLLPGKKG
ncbi:SprT-like domain-containing protein [Sorangium sp. So ce1024]|uniref:SprT-like domain-containing protein n=1 Tax=unclassified Sorangium TaxID=2621164 RepID=UPI003F100D5E